MIKQKAMILTSLLEDPKYKAVKRQKLIKLALSIHDKIQPTIFIELPLIATSSIEWKGLHSNPPEGITPNKKM